MKLAIVFTTTLIVIFLQLADCNKEPMYGAKASTPEHRAPPPNSYASKRVGISPTTPYCSNHYGSDESSEEHMTAVDHYMPKVHCKDGHCPEKRLPLSLCVQLPSDAHTKLSKNLLHQIVCSLMDPSKHHLASNSPYESHKKPCEYPKKPCACTKKPYTPPKEPCDKPKETYEPPHKVYEPTPKPCAEEKPSYEQPKKTYTPHLPCHPTYAPEVHPYEPTKKPYTPPHVPCKPTYAPEKESYEPPKK
uniref:Uncharacterized protein n=1 Tax=Anopheles maculatus TaxID=74869 RepID=A0A182TBG9_9DIPT